MAERLQKVLSQLGVASRRQAESMISRGQVYVNGEQAHLGQKIDPAHDQIEVDGKPIQSQLSRRYYILLNKPLGVVSTCSDPRGRSTVLDLLPARLRSGTGIHPVGRLDQNSTGALILTNDGELTFRLTHPKHQIPKTYRVWVRGRPTKATLEHWRRGVVLEGRKTLPARISLVSPTPDFPVSRPAYTREMTCFEIVMTEGRNRQIRRIADILEHPVVHLHRFKIGKIVLEDAKQESRSPTPCWRYLKEDEVAYLSNA